MRLRPRTTTLLVSLGTAAALVAAGRAGRGAPRGTAQRRARAPARARRPTPCRFPEPSGPRRRASRTSPPPGCSRRRPAGTPTRRTGLSLSAPGTTNPTRVRGLQVDGYFPDTSAFNTTHGWNHDSQFVLRIPDHWNGGLVVAGAPGNRKQYSSDFLISDFVLDQGFAYASTDKGNNSPDFYRDGTQPGDAVAEWHERVTQLAVAAKDALSERYGHKPDRTYMAGISNGGYLVRWQLENRPELYDGGVDWEGTLFTPDGPNLFTYLPTAVRYTLGDATADDMYAAGFAPGLGEAVAVPQGLLLESDPEDLPGGVRPGVRPGVPGGRRLWGPTCSCRARGMRLRHLVRRPGVAAGTRRARAGQPDRQDREAAAHAARDAGHPAADRHRQRRLRGDDRRPAPRRLHRYYRIVGGNHVDSLMDKDPEHLRPMLPCFRTAFDALTAWVEDGKEPPASATVPRPAGNGATDSALLDTCSLAAG